TAYLHTFYADALALCAFFALTGFGLLLALSRDPSPRQFLAFTICSALYITSKSQHSFAGVVIVVFLIFQATKAAGKWRSLPFVCAAALACLTALMIRTVPEDYRADPFFSVVFYDVIEHSEQTAADLAALGLTEAHLVARGMYAFENRWPANDVPWKIQ